MSTLALAPGDACHDGGVEAPARPRSFEVHGDVDAGARLLAAWEQHNREALIELSCQVADGVAFRAREVTVEAGDLRLASVRGTAHVVERDAGTAPAEAIAVYAALHGEALVETDAGRLVVRPGQLLVCDLDRPLLRGFGRGLHELAVRVPKAAIASLTGLSASAVLEPLVVDATGQHADPHARALVRLVSRALGGPSDGALPADRQAVVELVSILATGGDVAPSTRHRAAVRAFVDDHLADPALGAADVAAGAGVSERHLSRLLADAGTTLPRHVLARRLDRAYVLLRDAADPALRTVDVAARCGFTSTAWFSQAFAARFGVAAGVVRREA